MKIQNIKINSFGNLQDKEIDLSNNINIIYGKNEAGKSTLLKFITNMFYGTSKNKKGRLFSDYDRYKPWGREDFSGRIKYELDNGEQFEVFREFAKKNPKVYNSNMEDISKQFTIDKSLGNQFFYEQTKVDEQAFLSTIASMQQEVKLDKNSQNSLIQRMANLAGTGEDNVSYKKAIDKLYKKQLDEVGTYRSTGKPINIAQGKLNDLKNKKHELLGYKNLKYDFEENKANIEEEISQDELKVEILKKMQKINKNEDLEHEKLHYNVDLIKKDEMEILELINEKNHILEDYGIESEEVLVKDYNDKINSLEPIERRKFTARKVEIKKYILLTVIVILINVLLFVLLKDNLLKFVGLIGFPIIIALYFIEKSRCKTEQIIKQNKEELSKKVEENKKLKLFEKNKQVLEEINIVNAKIEVFEKDKREQLKIMDETKERIKSLKEIEKEKLKNTYRSKMDIYEINKLINVEDTDSKLEEIRNDINDKKLELHRIELNKNNIMPQLEDLAQIEEELVSTEEEYEGLMKKNNSMIVVKQALEDAYEKMKKDVTPRFTNSLSENIAKISNNKYNKVSINDENGMMVELQSGEYVPAERLSLGTIDQLYLSLRLSMNTEVSSENMPVILDEAFAYYDDDRLENILKFLAENYKDKQIIILTCTSREEEIYNKLGYTFNKVRL
ncbi:MAG: AAA family ATPase [Clostridia bacterium]|nr:AAA family ATPase [Clostridia bacterium]